MLNVNEFKSRLRGGGSWSVQGNCSHWLSNWVVTSDLVSCVEQL